MNLNEAFLDADHHALDDLDLEHDPRPVLGIGDTTLVQLEVWRRYGRPGVHGLSRPTGDVVRRETDDAVTVPGRAEGVLLGGSLTALRAMVGAGLPRLDGAIVLIDDVRVKGLGQVDRQLTHLRVAGALDAVRGIAVGRFPGYEGYADRGWTLLDVLRDQLSPLGVPVLGGLPLGPGEGAQPVWLGCPTVLDATAGTLRQASP
ncbi:hypothetical protein JIG36_08065 [Actinoplanes sp. LDG1-06]|uniref:LD-carboxypeptidase C-terminal domain-containing protein n=1 Tax=Paractinoplanes ovalisporus TaxID=2810368 RepID=A0ABS2A6S5_9ACTN|nr:hypothetical protein [Actinoplanes ovalisporus]MBM2615519.1 hypothetical protein [Actinoplanes ovalisporus]